MLFFFASRIVCLLRTKNNQCTITFLLRNSIKNCSKRMSNK